MHLAGAGGLGVPGLDAVPQVCNAEDRRDISVIGGEEAALPLPIHVETASAGDVEIGKGVINNAVQGLTMLYKAVAEGTYGVEGERLYAPDGTWMYAEICTPRGEVHRRRGRV